MEFFLSHDCFFFILRLGAALDEIDRNYFPRLPPERAVWSGRARTVDGDACNSSDPVEWERAVAAWTHK